MYPESFIEWCLDNNVSKGILDTINYEPCYDFVENGHASYYETIDELYKYWRDTPKQYLG